MSPITQIHQPRIYRLQINGSFNGLGFLSTPTAYITRALEKSVLMRFLVRETSE
jgi:hypothetical protein